MGRLGLAVRTGAFAAAVAAGYAWLGGQPVAQEPAVASIPADLAASATLSAPSPPVPVPAEPEFSSEGLVLYGVSGEASNAAAIIGSRLGGQRVVTVGHDYRPGLKLAEVGVDYAVLRNGPRGVRLELSRYDVGGGARLTAALPAEQEQKIEAAVLRNILTPVRMDNRIGGYALKPGESLPRLVRAGLRPGDIILSVNGSQLDEERMSELAWQMGNASKTEFIFVRNGKKIRATL